MTHKSWVDDQLSQALLLLVPSDENETVEFKREVPRLVWVEKSRSRSAEAFVECDEEVVPGERRFQG